MAHVKVIRVGGPAKKVARDWDDEAEFRGAQQRKFLEWMREWEALGYLTYSEPKQDGDYRNITMTLEFPE